MSEDKAETILLPAPSEKSEEKEVEKDAQAQGAEDAPQDAPEGASARASGGNAEDDAAGASAGAPEDVPEDATEGQGTPLLPLRNGVFFPEATLTLNLSRAKSVEMIKHIDPTEGVLAIVTQRDPEVEDPTQEDLYEVGTLARIIKKQKTGRQSYSILIQGTQRITLESLLSREPYWRAEVNPVVESVEKDSTILALDQVLRKTAREVIRISPELPKGTKNILHELQKPGALADILASLLDLSVEDKMRVLSTFSLKERLETTLEILAKIQEVLAIRKKIEEHIRDDVAKKQKETVLRQQLEAIQRELGIPPPTRRSFEQGREKGRLEAYQELLVFLSGKRFGILPSTALASIEQASRLKLKQILEKFDEFEGLDDLLRAL